jgi:hypothetical protein
MTSDDTGLQDLRRELWGQPDISISRAYLTTVKHLTAHTTRRLGVKESNAKWCAYWINNRTIGVLSCEGVAEPEDAMVGEEAKINGRIAQLDTLASVDLTVKTYYNQSENTSRWGRRLTIRCTDGYEIVLDASPGVFDGDARSRVEAFIDDVLGALATPLASPAQRTWSRPG